MRAPWEVHYSLGLGEFMCRSGEHRDLHLGKVPLVMPRNKFLPRDEVKEIMKDRLAELYEDVIPLDDTQPESHSEQPEENLDFDESDLLNALSRDFCRPATKAYQEIGWDNGKGHRFKKRLERKGYITAVETNLGEGGRRALFLVPNPIVFERLGINLGDGRGKALHKHFQQRIKAQAETLAFKAYIEYCIGDSKGPDVGVERNGLRIAIECCITSKPTTESQNIRKNFSLGFDFVILSFVNRQVLEKTKAKAVASYKKAEMAKVRLCLVSEVAQILGELQ